MDDLDPVTATSPDELAARLKRLYVRADRPSLRELEDSTKHAKGPLPGTKLRRVRLGRTTVSDVLAGRKFPKKAFLLTLVETLGVDLEADRGWALVWDWLAENQQAPPSPKEVERLRLENEELRRQPTAAKRQAEEAENRASQAPALNEATITAAGDLDHDPELRWTPSGQAVARFRIVSEVKSYDEQGYSREDRESLLLTCHVWDQLAENVAENLRQGTTVIVTGRFRQRSYETKEGEKGTVYEVEVDEVSASLNALAKTGTQLTIVGDCVNAPELRATSQNDAEARFRIASTPRFYHKASGEWKDDDTLFMTCYVRGQLAQSVAEYLKQGNRVTVTGYLRQRSYETKEGEKRDVYEVEVEEIGLSLLNDRSGISGRYSDEPPF
jgi:single stranded DNA-binding protein